MLQCAVLYIYLYPPLALAPIPPPPLISTPFLSPQSSHEIRFETPASRTMFCKSGYYDDAGLVPDYHRKYMSPKF